MNRQTRLVGGRVLQNNAHPQKERSAQRSGSPLENTAAVDIHRAGLVGRRINAGVINERFFGVETVDINNLGDKLRAQGRAGANHLHPDRAS